MRTTVLLTTVLSLLAAFAARTDDVNVFIGTAGNGHTTPAAA